MIDKSFNELTMVIISICGQQRCLQLPNYHSQILLAVHIYVQMMKP